MKKSFLIIALISIVIGCSTPPKKEVVAEQKTDKNVLFIMIDDLKPTLGTYGHSIVKSPNIDKLASMGVQFNNAHCNFAVCGPSRGSLMTGIRPENLTQESSPNPLT